MNHILIKNWLQNPSTITNDDAEEIKKAIDAYPYFAALRVLLAKAEKGNDEVVKSAAAYVSHRPSLQAFLDTDFDNNINLPSTSGIEIERDEAELLETLSSEQEISELQEEATEEAPTTYNTTEETTTIEEEEVENELTLTPIEREIESLNTSHEEDLEEKILSDLAANDEINTTPEPSETTTSTSIADEVLAELSRMSSQIHDDDENVEVETSNITEEKVEEEETIEVENNTIEGETIEEIDDDTSLGITSDEMMDRFQGFLDTKKKKESEIINELSQEDEVDADLLDFSKNASKYAVEDVNQELTFNGNSIPLYDINLPDDVTEENSYEESIKEMDDSNIIDFNQFNPESTMSSQQKIINHFINEHPVIPPVAQNEEGSEDSIDLSEVNQNSEFTPKTESFAKMLEKQGKKEEAISIYQHLILKNPNKATLFAERIEFLQKN
ncbi:hypothetical protein [Flammeovirga sp. SJP92]|uniref:hypothetical protein n=1 Tax=Flammeovirga sp. SJP92 TaxID=1775430 RepID=UPI000787AD5D|nr:hypothetical protein [Flammeovirga sp. SJP92]KXX72502.1 hypothetical protein AVL50_00080 [Flammeovirga sp. SJP92]